MRAKKAKKLRKQIYGEFSHLPRKYSQVKGGKINIGLRAVYLKAKKG